MRKIRAAMRKIRATMRKIRASNMAIHDLIKMVFNRFRALKLHSNIHHVYGSDRIDYALDELIVICIVRNGQAYLRSFIRHYFKLGVKHIIFLDNGSSDDTIKIASSYNNVTVFRTDLPYSKYENLMKNYLAQRFSKGRWNLCADIDEFFDWPFSGIVTLDSLLRYLNAKKYSAVIAQMLDLFSELPLSQLRDNPDDDDITIKYKYYDISSVFKGDYQYSRLSNHEVKMHWGGIRSAVFGTSNGLTKAALVFVGRRVRLFKDWHHAVNAYVADFTCVLLHYPFTSSFYNKVKDAAATKRYGPVTSDEYDMYWKRLSQEPGLSLCIGTERRYVSVDSLLDDGFLVASPGYREWVSAQKESVRTPMILYVSN